jgi:hypothetical protein
VARKTERRRGDGRVMRQSSDAWCNSKSLKSIEDTMLAMFYKIETDSRLLLYNHKCFG